MKQTTRMVAFSGMLATALLVSAGREGRAQSPAKVFNACYIPFTGTIYLILEPLLRTRCTGGQVQFHWTDGVLTRQELNGFAVTGRSGTGSIPIEGAGTRLMWYPGKSAFRVGLVDGTQWDNVNIGFGSIAMGGNSVARGPESTAIGDGATASGQSSTAIGNQTTARGNKSTAIGSEAEAGGELATALGYLTNAVGVASTAMGVLTEASGTVSTAMGCGASTNYHLGSFVYGDMSTVAGAPEDCSVARVDVTADNSFVVRAQNVWFGKNGDQVATAGRFIETSTGAYLSDGGDWTNASDVNRKENFQDEDGDSILDRLSRLPVQSWNYKAEDPATRHLGPTAQDFYAAFHLGASDKAIGTVDEAGVALLAIQALGRRTREQASEIEALRAELAALRAQLSEWTTHAGARSRERHTAGAGTSSGTSGMTTNRPTPVPVVQP